ncbi:uncharacterized protein METZ01_LOCUS274592, partial [marine metagenome]
RQFKGVEFLDDRFSPPHQPLHRA